MNTSPLDPLLLLLLLMLLFPLPPAVLSSSNTHGFVVTRFHRTNLLLDGSASTTPGGLLQLTNPVRQQKGHAFYPTPIQFKNTSAPNNKTFSFSSTFVFAIRSDLGELSGNGIAFVVSPTTNFAGATGSQYLGLLNTSNLGNPNDHLFFVELDTIFNPEIEDINDNHVGIDINSVISNRSTPAGYYGSGGFKNLTLISGDPMQVWVDYDGGTMQVDVTIAPINVSKPNTPLLSSTVDLSEVVKDQMFVGFSSTTGSFLASHYILGWSFATNGRAQPLDISNLPQLPPRPTLKRHRQNTLAIWVPVGVTLFLLASISVVVFAVMRRIKFAELFDDWEQDGLRNHRFSYKDLHRATKGFHRKELLGVGGFGRVYRGVLPGSKQEVAVKRIPHGSTKDMKDFITEIVSIGQLRHRNLVQQLGYCRREGELLLVYDFMPNGSLDKLLFSRNITRSSVLPWRQRFHIIKGVASALHYLHEEWEQVVIHRDIKANNVLLDGDFNAKLGDFGLARLYDHGSNPRTTHVVGTMGYLAPELTKTGKATKATDVFAFGMFVLEVVCGRRPIEPEMVGGKRVMVDWVLENWNKGEVLMVVDERMMGIGECEMEEVELVLKLGLVCCHPLEGSRPSMREVVDILEGETPLPETSSEIMNAVALAAVHKDYEMDDYKGSSFSPLLAGTPLWSGR